MVFRARLRGVWRALAIAVFLAATAAPATAQLVIDVGKGHLQPTPIAIPALVSPNRDPDAAQLGRDIAEVISANLVRSSLFRAIDEDAFIETIDDFNLSPRFNDWRLIGAQALITGQVQIDAQGRLLVGYRLWDTTAQEQVTALQLESTRSNWRRVAHRISDSIYNALTGEEGYFDTRIVYIEESGPKTDPTTRLTIMDQDSENRQFLTDGRYLVFLPTFSPEAQQIVYVSYREGAPKTYLFDIETGREEALFVVSAESESYSARFSPDGRRVVTTVSQGGNSDIYVYDLRTRRRLRLTQEPSIEVEPSYDPTGRFIVFTSDRTGAGQRQLYVMAADGSRVRRISRGEGRYGTPVWSPRGDLIAFTKQYQGRFFLGVMEPDGARERILAEHFKIDRPAWSPNGRVLIYTSEQASDELAKQIRSVDLTGFNDRPIGTLGSASDPAWSPLLK